MSRLVACLAGLSITRVPFGNQLKRLKELCYSYNDVLLSLEENEDVKVRSKLEKIKNQIYDLLWARNGDHNGVFVTSLIEIGNLDIVIKWINGESISLSQDSSF